MVQAVEQLSKIDWQGFLITLAIVIAAYVAIKKGLEELSKYTGWEMPYMTNNRVHRELSEAVVAIKDELVSLRNDVKHVQEEVDSYNGKRSNDRQNSVNIRKEMYKDLDKASAELRKELIDSVKSIEGKIDILQKKIEDNELRKRIDGLRSTIIGFATNLSNPQFRPSLDHYNSVFTKIEEYEEVLEIHGLENGQTDVSVKIIKKHFEEAMENGDFLEVRE